MDRGGRIRGRKEELEHNEPGRRLRQAEAAGAAWERKGAHFRERTTHAAGTEFWKEVRSRRTTEPEGGFAQVEAT